MEQRIRTRLLIATLAALVGVALSGAHALGDTLAGKCQSGKNRAVGKLFACRHNAEAKLATTGDGAKYSEALGKCATRYGEAWLRLEANAGGACPTSGDQADIENVAVGCTSAVATALGGGLLADCSTDRTHCLGDLATCQAAVSGAEGQRLKTGGTVCHDGFLVIPCAGTDQDGELRKGLARSYVDHGDGTITDHRTGLMWEKLSDDGSIHDKDGSYTWTQAFSVKIATLNSIGFAGHADWRLPNRAELESLVNLGGEAPHVDAAFDTACTAGCTVTTCSCTRVLGHYWTSTTAESVPWAAWLVGFDFGTLYRFDKGDSWKARAVRGGS